MPMPSCTVLIVQDSSDVDSKALAKYLTPAPNSRLWLQSKMIEPKNCSTVLLTLLSLQVTIAMALS